MNDFWKSRPCLVTGGTGFGGSHLVEQLVARGARVHVLDRLFPRNSYLKISGVANTVDLIVGDIRDQELVKSVLERCEIDTVFHLAAQPIVPMSNSLPYDTLSINALGTYAMLEAVRQARCPKRFVFASSAAYYGTTRSSQAIPEDQGPLVASNIYSPSKVAADIAVRCYAETYGLKAVVCRFINTYGPGDTNFSRIIPRAIRNLILANSYDFGGRDDGTTSLDYLHIQDMANAYVRVAEQLEAVAGQAFNFGAGQVISTRDLAKMVSRIFDGKERDPTFSGPQRELPVIKRLEVAKAKRILHWEASTPLQQGLEETIAWYRRFWSEL